ncbi:MAG: 2-amino-4-hydroxy-6-hydroxymethyldihydropteridine diphosphokinase [Paludibacteraceae bacterium]|nr:2-amino-4-hydroxy-6-hydroxymethyldihydropteridine diphosphokinase [Paludibacteraceae bacterium]
MTYYLSLGSNLGDREATIRQALQRIEQQIGPVRRCSSFYYSKPWGFESEHDFCNLCCAVETDKTPLEVLHLTQTIERALGRKEKSAISNQQLEIYSDRCIDIDLIRVFDEQGQEICLDTPELTLPHKFWQQRDFVKIPLGEIMQP